MSSSVWNSDNFHGRGGESCEYYTSNNGADGNDIHGNPSLETTEWIDYDPLSSDFPFYDTTSLEINHGELLPATDDRLFVLDDGIHSQVPETEAEPAPTSPPPPAAEEQPMIGKVNSDARPKSLYALKHLCSYGAARERRRLQGEKLFGGAHPHLLAAPRRRLSTEEVMRVAGTRFIQFAQGHGFMSMVSQPYGSMLSTLTTEDMADVDLAHLLFSAADEVGNQEYDSAGRLLTHCERSASVIGNPVQRVVHHFAGALRKRIDVKTGKKLVRVEEQSLWGEDVSKKLFRPQPAIIALHRHLPFSQLTQLTEVEVILDNVASSARNHLIDLGIRIGLQWIGLMQALSTRSTITMELLRITAVGISKQTITETGDRLADFAKTMNLPFAFEGIVLPDLKGWKEDMFPSPDSGESVVVYAHTVLKTLLDKPTCLGNLVRMIKRLNPRLMVVTEMDANQHSTSFSHQFVESLFFYSAWFDCLGDCMGDDDANRLDVETNFLSPGIWSMVAAGGKDGAFQSVGMGMWRAFFPRFGFVGVELSEKLMYQASLIVKRFAYCGSSCTFDREDNCLTMGWKGTPLLFVSAWKLG